MIDDDYILCHVLIYFASLQAPAVPEPAVPEPAVSSTDRPSKRTKYSGKQPEKK